MIKINMPKLARTELRKRKKGIVQLKAKLVIAAVTKSTGVKMVDAPQALKDRRSTNIADLVVLQLQCMQGGTVPARGHSQSTQSDDQAR